MFHFVGEPEKLNCVALFLITILEHYRYIFENFRINSIKILFQYNWLLLRFDKIIFRIIEKLSDAFLNVSINKIHENKRIATKQLLSNIIR